MKKNLFTPIFYVLLACCALWSCGSSDNDSGEVVKPPFKRTERSIEMKSTILGQTVKYSVLFPKDYDKTTTDYAVVYLLHGYGDNENAWLDGGRIENHVDLAVSMGHTKPLILVMPHCDNSYYVDNHSGSRQYMKMITEELVPLVDKNYRTIKDANHRAMMGYSMGGYGAFILPSINPNLFSTSVSLSMSWRTDAQYMAEPQGVWDNQFGAIFGGTGQSGQGRITEYFKQHSPFHFFLKNDLSKYKKVKYLLDCGDDEAQLSITNDELHSLMLEKGITHEYRMRNGAHNWDYWSASMDEAFKFIQLSFDESSLPEEEVEVASKPDAVRGQYSKIAIEGVGENIGIYLPEEYANSGLRYPVIYLLHDRKDVKEDRESIKKVLSLMETAYIVDGLSQVILVELPTDVLNKDGFAEKTMEHIDNNYRSLAKPTARLAMANNLGGKGMEKLLTKVNACFLYNAEIPATGFESQTKFYYLDMTDKFMGSRPYGNLYAKLRNDKIAHEYRVRNGIDSYRSFLNGLPKSFSSMNAQLDKPEK